MLKALFLSLLFCFSWNSFAQLDYAKKILDTLCSPHFDGRGYVNEGDVRAGTFIEEELKRIGVQSFPGQSYSQPYAFNVNSFPFPIEVVLGEDTLRPGIDYLVNPYSGTAQGEFDVIEINKKTYYDIFGGKINFKTMDPSQTIFAFNFLDNTDKELQKRVDELSYEVTNYFPCITVTNKKKMYSVGRKPRNYPSIEIDSAAYHTVETANIKVANQYIPKYKSKNVIGYIPGKKKKKYVILSAHYDHLGRMGPDTYFPGANDNASGVAMLLSLAKYYIENPAKYSIVICFFSGEEAGLVGSKYFVEHPYFPLKKARFVLNIDILGGADDGITVVNGTAHEKEFNSLVELNDKGHFMPTVKKRGAAANSDHHFFSQMGVPAFFIYSMGSVKNYHDVYDTAENTPLTNFDEAQMLFQQFISTL